MKLNLSLCICVVLLLSVLCAPSIKCSKYTAKELEELRRFYYDDDEVYVDVDSSEKEKSPPKDTSKNKNRPRPESRSKSSTNAGNQQEEESSEEERVLGPGVFINDARKLVDAGRKAIDRAAHRVLPQLPSPPPLLPRIRASRASKHLNVQKIKEDVERGDVHEKVHGNQEMSEDDEGESHSPSRLSSEDNAGEKRKEKAETEFKNPFEKLQNDAAKVAADTGGKILSILNKLTPRPIPGLPTPIPNLEDFGG